MPADRDFEPGPGPPAGSLSATFLRASALVDDFTAFCTVSAAFHVHISALIASSHQANYFCVAPPNWTSVDSLEAAAPDGIPKHELSAIAFGILSAKPKRQSECESQTLWRDLFILSLTDRKHPHSAVWELGLRRKQVNLSVEMQQRVSSDLQIKENRACFEVEG